MKKVFFGICFVSILLYLNRVGEEDNLESVEAEASLICGDQPQALAQFLNQYAAEIEAVPEKWMYSNKASDFKDCSGMFI